MKKNGLLFLFLALCITDVLAATGWPLLVHQLVKPLLVPVLWWMLYTQTPKERFSSPLFRLFSAALLFSWLGDVSLLGEDRNPHFFMAGLGCFLAAHLCFVFFFCNKQQPRASIPLSKWIWALGIAAYGSGLVVLLYPGLGSLLIPVLLYAMVLCTMLYSSILPEQRHKYFPIGIFVTGALFFVVSDSLLAINKFYHSFSSAGAWVMLTYCGAQLLLTQGAIDRLQKKQPYRSKIAFPLDPIAFILSRNCW